MALLRSGLGDIQYIPSSAGSLKANASGQKLYVRGFVIFNSNTTAETVKLYAVPDSGGALGTAGVSNQIFEAAIQPLETLAWNIEYPIVMTGTNDSIQGVTNTASKVTIILLGDIDDGT